MPEFLEKFRNELNALTFGPPVTHVYNPLDYALGSYTEYLERYGQGPKRVVMMGMNPGPWGMAQSGIPFGEVAHARDWLGIRAAIGRPAGEHPARPVTGWDCARSEVSGRRLWGTLKEHFKSPEAFFNFAFVANYCPLLFLEESGRNRTPDKLPAHEREPLLRACDKALLALLEELQPERVIGIGKWAAGRAAIALEGSSLAARGIVVTSVPHPSPANPAANRGWGQELLTQLDDCRTPQNHA